MRVAFDLHTLGKQATGNESYARGLWKAMSSISGSGLEMVGYGDRDTDAYAGFQSIRRLRPNYPLIRIPFTTPAAMWLDKIDIGHFQYTFPPFLKSKVVLTVHDVSYEKYPEFFNYGFVKRLKVTVPWMVRHSDHVIAVSENTRKDILEIYNVDPNKVSVVYNGVSDIFYDREINVESQLGLLSPYILCVGNICHRKNQARVVDVYSRLISAGKIDCDLVLVGKLGVGGAQIIEQISANQNSHRIHRLGFVSDRQLVSLYRSALFTLYPSLYEGFGIPVIESMVSGVPVITSNNSCLSEISGNAAVLVDPRSDDELEAAIESLFGNAELRAKLSKRGVERVRKFTWTAAASSTMDIYRRVGGGA